MSVLDRPVPPSARVATVTLNPAIDHSVGIPNFTAGSVNRVAWEQADAGGKGVNVASFLRDLGVAVSVTGFLGRDNAPEFERLFERKSIADRFVRLPGKTRVNVKILDEAQDRITDINFPGQHARAGDRESLEQAIAALVPDHDWFVLSGSVPAGIPFDVYAELTATLKAAGKRVVVDTSGAPLRAALRGAPFAVKPNIAELEECLGRPLPDAAAAAAAARTLVADGVACVVVSMGGDGALFVDASAGVLAVPPPVEVRSTVGAGDAMVAGLIAAKLRGLPLADCARLATATAVGALVEVGPRLPPRSNIDDWFRQVSVEPLAF
jgi:1-phosphofructokinase